MYPYVQQKQNGLQHQKQEPHFNCTILNEKPVVIQPPFLQHGQSYIQVFSIMNMTRGILYGREILHSEKEKILPYKAVRKCFTF